MANGSTADKARKARNKAEDAKYMWRDSERLANKIAKTATGKDLTMDEESRAGKIIQNRRMLDTGKTATRASFIERRTAKKAAEKRMTAAVGGGAAPKKQAPKAATKKAPAKPTSSFGGNARKNMKKAK
jgi:3-phenylpropionate/cinnamic acid dioxygenase small subunit